MSETLGVESIRDDDRAKQLIKFDGMELGERMWPTDVDALIEWKGKGWLLFEVKHGGKSVPRGQELSLERFVEDVEKAGKYAVAAIVEHHIPNPFESIILADCDVRRIYKGWTGKWSPPKHPMTAKELMDEFVGWVNDETEGA